MQATTAERYGMLSRFLPVTPALIGPFPKTHPTPFRVLIVESSVPLGRLLATGLLADNLSVELTHDLASIQKHFDKLSPELLILDMDLRHKDLPDMTLPEGDLPSTNLPDTDGPRLLRELRSQHPGLRILALSARAGIEDMVSALDNGADDYLPKPFSLIEMMARVRALRRRSQAVLQPASTRAAALVLHPDQCCVERDGRRIELTRREFTLLDCLMQNSGKTLSRAVLAQKVWNMASESSTNIVDVYIKYLRDKLDGDHDVKLIRTVRGMGYSYQTQS